MKRRDLIREMEEAGWRLHSHGHDHDIYVKPRERKVPVPRDREIVGWFLGEIRRQTGLKQLHNYQ